MKNIKTKTLAGAALAILVSLFTPRIADAQQTATAATAEEEEVRVLDPFTVTEDQDVAYTSTNNISAIRMDIATKNLPQSITVFNRELLEDTNLVSLTGFMELDPSYANGFSEEDGIGRFVARGLSGGGGLLFVDGFDSLGNNSIIPVVGVDRVEILKGPNAVLYGEENPAGVVNRVTKRPTWEPRGSLRATVGQNNTNGITSHGYYLDLSGPLDSKLLPESLGDFAYRVEAQYGRRGTVKDTAPAEQFSFYPALTWRISRATSLTVYGWYTQTASDVQWEVPVLIENGGLTADGKASGRLRFEFPLPDGTSQVFDEPRELRHTAPGKTPGDDDARETSNWVGMYDFRHQFSDQFSFRSQAKWEKLLIDRLETLPLIGSDEWPVNVDPATGNLAIGYTDPTSGEFLLGGRPGRTYGVEQFGVPVTALDWLIPRRPRFRDEDQKRFDIRNELAVTANTGPISHRLLVGQSYANFKASRIRVEVRNPGTFPVDYVGDILSYPEDGRWEFVSTRDPVGGGPANFPRSSVHNPNGQRVVPREDFVQNNPRQAESTVSSVYINDTLSTLNDQLWINLGYRYQENKNKINNRTADGDTFGIGALYHLDKDQTFSLYANANQSFQPVFAISDDGYDLPPITGEQFEVGIKWDLGGRFGLPTGFLTGNLTYFDIELTNIPENVAENPDQDTILRPNALGRKSEGIEFWMTAAPMDGLRLFGGFTHYLSVEDPSLTGERLADVGLSPREIWPENIAEWTANLFARYEFRDGPMSGFYSSLGIRYISARNGEIGGAGGIDRTWNILYRVPAETTLNLGIGKRFQFADARYTVSLFVDNVTDEERTGRMIPFKVSFDPGRSWRLEVRADF